MSLMAKLADAAVQEADEMQTPIRRGVDGTDGDKANVNKLSKAGGSIDLGAGSDVFNFGGKKNVSGWVSMGEEAGTSGYRFDKDRDILKLEKDLSDYTIYELKPGHFNVTDNATGTSITFTGVEIIKTKSEIFNLNEVSIEDVIAQSGSVDWDGNNRATLNDVNATGWIDATLDLGAGSDMFRFNHHDEVGRGTVDLGAGDGAVDRVVLQGTINDYKITNYGTGIINVKAGNSSIDFVGMGEEDLFVFANVEKFAGKITANYENDVFTLSEMNDAAEEVLAAKEHIETIDEANSNNGTSLPYDEYTEEVAGLNIFYG